MSGAKDDFEKIDRFLRLAQSIDKFKDCHTVYDLFEITDKSAPYPDIEKKIESFVNSYAGNLGPKFKDLNRVISREAETVKRVLRDHRRAYNEYLQEHDPGIQKLREHFAFCTKRDKKLDSKEKAELIEEAKEVGLSDAAALTLINKWLIDRADSSATSSTRPFTDFLGKTYYEILGVSDDADYAKIKDAYDREYSKYNTSRDKAKASARFFVVSEAWECLKDSTKRREYDEKLKQPKTSVPTGMPRLVVECKSDYTFKDVRRGTTISEKITIKNPEGGLLQGMIKSDSLWLEPDRSKVLEKHEQELYINILTSKIPPKMYKTEGHITIDTNGGPPYTIPFKVFLQNYEIELQRFRKTWVPVCAAVAGLIGSFVSQNHFTGFLIGMFMVGFLGYILSKEGLELFIRKGIDLSKYPPVALQGMSVGFVVLAIIAHSGGKYQPPSPPDRAALKVTRSVIAEGFDSNKNPTGVSTQFSGGNKTLYCYVSYTGGIPKKTVFLYRWYKDNDEIGNSQFTLVYESGNAWSNLPRNYDAGTYEVKLYANGQQLDRIVFSVSRSSADLQREEEQRRHQEAEPQRREAEQQRQLEEQRRVEEQRRQREAERERQEAENLQRQQQRQLEEQRGAEQRQLEEQRKAEQRNLEEQRRVEQRLLEEQRRKAEKQRQLREQQRAEEQRRQREAERERREAANPRQQQLREAENIRQQQLRETESLRRQQQVEGESLRRQQQRVAPPPYNPNVQRRSAEPPSRPLRSDGWQKSRESVTYEDN
jgi:hypothetical protein